MGLSTSLLLVAVVSALVPLASLGPRPPESIRDLEKVFVFGFLTLAMGTIVVISFHPLNIFGWFHLAYLIAVVGVPLLLGGWWLFARIRDQRRRWTNVAGVVAALVALAGAWATHIEPNWLRTDHATLVLEQDVSLRIGVLADLQTSNVGQHERNAVDTLLASRPDIVLLPGDLFQGERQVITEAAPDFGALLRMLAEAVPHVFLVPGDSDQPDQLKLIAAGTGVTYLENEIVTIEVADQTIRVAGIAVPATSDRLDTLAALAEPSDDYTILLTHRPGAVLELADGSDVDLVVGGHTHGGQVSVPFFGPPVTFSPLPRDIAAGGLGAVNGYPVYVSAGVGLERHQAPQIRFGVRPEVGVIDIYPVWSSQTRPNP